jgi:preprotein translocase subunit SecA
MRREILHQTDISKRIKLYIEEEVKALANSELATTDKYEALLKEVFPFSETTLDELFDTPAENFEQALLEQAKKLYEERTETFGVEAMRKIERDIYLQILDNLWMQHLENMDHLREGIHWISVGQRDPLVEYRRQGQHMFEEMQDELRHDVMRAVFNAEPSDVTEQPTETELTRAARKSVDNADKIIEADEFTEDDFVSTASAPKGGSKKLVSANKRKKAHKVERKRRKQGKKR